MNGIDRWLVRQLDEVGELKSTDFFVPHMGRAVLTYERRFFNSFGVLGAGEGYQP